MPDPTMSETDALGPRYDRASGLTTFTVFAHDATRVVLELYPDAVGASASYSVELTGPVGGVWSRTVPGAGPGTLYGFRCWGRNWPYEPAWTPGSPVGFRSDLDQRGNRFNPNKVLLDPYAREVSHTQFDRVISEAGHTPAVFAQGPRPYRDRPSREADTGPWAPKGVIVDDDTPTGTRPGLNPQDATIYEAHVKHLTAHPSSGRLRATLAGIDGFADVADVPAGERGTYRGAARMAGYLRALGVTTVEFLPVQQSSSGANEVNSWGYKTLGFFAPHREYALDRSPGGPTREFKEMVHAFHDAGLEVYLDVVYNHTGEGGSKPGEPATTELVSQGGFACADYYVLTSDFGLESRATRVQNQVDYASPFARRLVLDSLAYWVDVMGVDGFRFDLAPVLGQRDGSEFSATHPLLLDIERFARDRHVEVIAEPWDAGGSYQFGAFPRGWAEWNDRFRDAVRRFLRGEGNAPQLAGVLNGSYEAFHDQGGPHRSVNFVTAHDGFTLLDLVSYDHKLNDQGWPFGPSDGGSDHNLSWDSGGDHRLRRQRIRGFLTLLFLARGVPMVVAGDELGRTQNGNNNVYNLDNLAMATNYAMAATNTPSRLAVDPDRPDLPPFHDNFGAAAVPGVNPVFRFATYLARLRREHSGLRQAGYGDLEPGNADVSYLFTGANGAGPLLDGDRWFRLRIDCGTTGTDDLLVMANIADGHRHFVVPDAGPGRQWRRIIDTADWFEPQNNCWDAADPAEATVIEGEYWAPSWAIVVLRLVRL